MADRTAIEWTDATWNPVTGCTKVSAGCDNCYAERFSERFRGVAGHPFESGFDLTLRHERMEQPLRWKSARRIFVNSMSDLFHKGIPKAFIDSVFDTMERADWHQFQVLTKRSSRLRDYVNSRYGNEQAPPHIWLGISIENQSTLIRLKHLKQAAASVRFISFEPLLGPIGDVDLDGIHWVIAGGESGPGARPVQIDWLRSIRDQCKEQHVAFFFKQWGGRTPKAGGNEIDGRCWLEWPQRPSSGEAWVA
jgi:protein gp37